MADERADQQGAVIAFRASAELMDTVKAAAAKEGISRSDVARRALIRDLKPEPACPMMQYQNPTISLLNSLRGIGHVAGFAGAKSGLLTGQEMDRPGKCETLKIQNGYSDAI